jgi:hypothetical protein
VASRRKRQSQNQSPIPSTQVCVYPPSDILVNSVDDGWQTLEDNLGMSKPFGRFRRVFEVVTSSCGMDYVIG